MMEDSLPLKASWGVEAKAMQQCLTDIFTSVYTTCDIPENAIFGPCVLSHTSLYDSIAFIALKSTDKRTAPYIFRVDTSAVSGSSEGRVWLRLVQSARDGEEQNLEAYVKNGQLFYRSLRRIGKDEELLVWYGKDLVALLLLSSSRAHARSKGAPPYVCQDCNQRFQFEFPFLAHSRFCCTKGLYHMNRADGECEDRPECADPTPPRSSPEPLRPAHRRPSSQDAKPATDFHNLARDLENNRVRPPSNREAEIRSGSKRKYSEEEEEEEENRSRSSSKSPVSKEDLERPAQQCREVLGSGENRRAFPPPGPEPGGQKRSAFTEVRKASDGPQHRDTGRLSAHRPVLTETQPRCGPEGPAPGSAFSSVPRPIGSPDRKSAFSQPCLPSHRLSPLELSSKLLPSVPCPGRLYQPDPLLSRLHSQDLLAHAGPKQSPFLFTTPFWPKASGAMAVQLPPALTLLPPSFTSLCLPAQNWCAKCNASFRMTSDLVYHMRSHHKKEFAVEPLVKRRREEKLKCPICSEAFRERHHLSRHMTSHN
ncbi:PR domain zinc finger protein 8-like [Conger conger]|uniref:PR domain zinc finger protein 8-like n=1 Tax=Conger conger TaxID=82655 RepID=UPI002A5A79AF|nr:PR domain zinc finger protein 8-like [Conger conger]